MNEVAAFLACTVLAACGPQVTYVPSNPTAEPGPPRDTEAVRILWRPLDGCPTRVIGTIATNCNWQHLRRMRAIAAEHGADAIGNFEERDYRSAPHKPRDGNRCTALALVFVDPTREGCAP